MTVHGMDIQMGNLLRKPTARTQGLGDFLAKAVLAALLAFPLANAHGAQPLMQGSYEQIRKRIWEQDRQFESLVIICKYDDESCEMSLSRIDALVEDVRQLNNDQEFRKYFPPIVITAPDRIPKTGWEKLKSGQWINAERERRVAGCEKLRLKIEANISPPGKRVEALVSQFGEECTSFPSAPQTETHYVAKHREWLAVVRVQDDTPPTSGNPATSAKAGMGTSTGKPASGADGSPGPKWKNLPRAASGGDKVSEVKIAASAKKDPYQHTSDAISPDTAKRVGWNLDSVLAFTRTAASTVTSGGDISDLISSQLDPGSSSGIPEVALVEPDANLDARSGSDQASPSAGTARQGSSNDECSRALAAQERQFTAINARPLPQGATPGMQRVMWLIEQHVALLDAKCRNSHHYQTRKDWVAKYAETKNACEQMLAGGGRCTSNPH